MENDIRYSVTNTIIKNSLKTLMESKPLNKIKIIDICKEAHISRTTFYNHYVDLYDLIEDFEKDILNDLDIQKFIGIEKTEENIINLLENVLDYIESNKKIYKRFFETKNMDFYNLVLNYCMDKMSINSYSSDNNNDFESSVFFTYHSFGFLSIVEKWINSNENNSISTHELAQIIAKYMIC
ncbi:MAG: TetR/AcrR family transcriptional regulator C-terminal domain-containing protein [Lachnospiraceae bacterium]|nr:TetR/AcrR family transcriptional regulator C-terminal domain-containing protein [Lachnospiraceae bacterium]